MSRDVIATFAAQPGALYAFVPSRSRPWGVYWEKAPTVVRWFKTRTMADGFAQVNFRGSLYFMLHAHYPSAPPRAQGECDQCRARAGAAGGRE